MLNEILRNIGLTEYETKIYLALVDLGESTSGEIMNKANINSGRIYQILDSLKEKGIISEVIKNKVKYFSPTNPKRIIDYLDEKENGIKKQKAEISDLLPQILSKINSIKANTKIEVHTGIEGMKTAYLKEMERYSQEEDLVIFGVKKSSLYSKKVFDFFSYKVYPERLRKKVNVRKINDLEFKKEGETPEKGVAVRYLPYPSTTITNVVKDLTIISILLVEEPIVITIESEEVAKGFKNQFETLWKVAKP